jgi:hypothetical protein
MLSTAYKIGSVTAVADFLAKAASSETSESGVAENFIARINQITVGSSEEDASQAKRTGNEVSASSPSTRQAVSWTSPTIIHSGRP